jgi:hypothetical protein
MTTPPLDADAYRRGWHDSANGAPARVPDEYETDATIAGWIWGWVDYGMGVDKRNDTDTEEQITEGATVLRTEWELCHVQQSITG